ncbi:FHA domain-containing protein [Brachybacterium saurashtrense]|uniref:FHA domain-containing protein n=1 Tax=Brachybacterium saurashtrense TaxID=556288 RepID=A0A345YNU5_9MICO|nr:FHA domain-containing protein [Brachybacterium saurashtrense]AXK45597.1 FHA domain-containing protein [Brachybacterium saurashtrense]RRR21032.1 FHA domain-containing protein [Brachybacterium saurashtrense]
MTEEQAPDAAPLLGPGVWTRQGPATLVLRAGAWAVLVPGLRKQVIEAAWTVLGERPAPEEFVDRLVAAGELPGLEALTALLFGFHAEGTSVLGVKGSTPVAAYTAAGAQHVAGTEEEPFVLRTLEGVHRIAFGDLPPEEGTGAPRLVAGVAPVRGFVQVLTDPESLGEAERTALAAQVEAEGRSIETAEAKQRRAARPAPTPKPATAPTSTSTSEPGPTARTTAPPPSPRPVQGAGAPATGEAPSSGPNLFAGLFGTSGAGATAAPGPTAPAAEPQAAEPSGAETSTPPRTAPAPPPATPARAEPADPERTAPAPMAPAAPAPAAPTVPAPAARADAPATHTPDPASPSDRGPQPSPAATDGAAPRTAGSGRRRLVSTSLFDRRPPRESSAPAGPTADGATTADGAASASPAQAARAAASAPVPTSRSAGTPAEVTVGGPSSPSTQDGAAPSSPTTAPQAGADRRESADAPERAAPQENPAGAAVTQVYRVDDGPSHPPADRGHDAAGEQSAPPPEAPEPPRSAAAVSGDLESSRSYDDLFGQTIYRRIEDAAVRRGEDEEHTDEPGAAGAVDGHARPIGPQAERDGRSPVADGTSAPTGTATTGSPHPAGPAAPAAAAAEPSPATEPPPAAGDFIDWVPGVGRSAPEIAQTAARRAAAPPPPPRDYPQVQIAPQASAPSAPPHGAASRTAPYAQVPPSPAAPGEDRAEPGSRDAADPAHSRTPTRADGASRPPAGDPRPADAAGRHQDAPDSPPPAAFARQEAPRAGTEVTLPGLVCPQGHANSPESSTCRGCGAALQGPARSVTRPPLGAVRISTGDRFVLDRTAIVGRRPRASRVSAHDMPQLITVPSPQQDISRSHLELRLEGWHVVAIDLGTTNGTTLHRHGYDPVRLRPREGVVLRDADQLDLGDGVHLLFGERV